MTTSHIEWTDATWNPTSGCDRISPGCGDHTGGGCYAQAMAKRLQAMGVKGYERDGDPRTSGPGFALTLHPDRLEAPLRWKKPRLVFVDSMSDLFHPDVPTGYIADVWAVMAVASRHTFQVLTKRPQRMKQVLDDPAFWARFWANGVHDETGITVEDLPLQGAWLGTSIESDRYTFRADHLRATRAAVRFLSLEPLLGPLPSLDLTGIAWCIVGGESGPGARPMDLAWARDIRDQCSEAGVACFVKQLGSRWSGRHHKDLKGGHIETFPEDLRIREMPATALRKWDQ